MHKLLLSVYLYLLILKKEFYHKVVPFLKYYYIFGSTLGALTTHLNLATSVFK